MTEPGTEPLRAAAPVFEDIEAKRARAGVAAALFGDLGQPDAGEADAEFTPEPVTVGRYELRSRLGAGGMGVVYRAHDPDLDRPVALKLLHHDAATDDKARARMLREARALAKLAHPNVITVFDVGTAGEQVFVAMELVAGTDLRQWLIEHRDADWREVLGLFVAAGRGLAAAHALGLIHRDFKPDNVLVGADGRVRVLDFGLARIQRPASVVADTTEDDGVAGARTIDGDRAELGPRSDRRGSTEASALGDPTRGSPGASADVASLATFGPGLTETGAVLGTPLYMAPEVYAGKPADERSDQFGFCASLYEGLYRQLPFGARTLAAHVEAVTAGRLAPAPEGSAVPAAIAEILARGLAADPQGRYPDVETLLAALERAAAGSELAEASSAAGSLRWVVVVAGVLLAVAGLIAAELGWFGAEPPPVPPPTDLRSDVEPASAGTPVAAEADRDPEPSEAPPNPPVEASTSGPAPEPEPEPETEPTPEPSPNPALDDWCHLHEDQFTLLARTRSRRANLLDTGRCYQCRVERRSSRTRNFNPKDCAGYSLCGPAPIEDCG